MTELSSNPTGEGREPTGLSPQKSLRTKDAAAFEPTMTGQADHPAEAEFSLEAQKDQGVAMQETIIPQAAPTVTAIDLRQKFAAIFGIVDDPDDAHAQAILAHVSVADASLNGRKAAALEEAFTTMIGPLPASIRVLVKKMDSMTEMTPSFIRLQDGSRHGRQVFKLNPALAGGQGSVHVVINPSLTPTDPDLFQVVKILGKPLHATIHPETHEFDTMNRTPGEPLDPDMARLNTEAAVLRHIQAKKLTHIAPRLIDQTVTADGSPALVSEFLRGRDLNTFVKNGKKISPQAGYDIMAYLASHFHQLHTMEEDSDGNVNGVVHRDVKPANLFLTSDGRMKVIDFGLAKYRGAEVITKAGGETMTNTIAGTGAFMAPEQFGNVRHASYPADVYSLAATLVPLIAGRTVYEGNPIEMSSRHADPERSPVEALQALREAGVDPKIVSLFERCLHKATEKDRQGRVVRLSLKQTGRPAMYEILAELAPYTTWGKKSKKYTDPDALMHAIRTGAVRIEGLLDDHHVRDIGISRNIPDGFPGGESEFLDAFARQYPLEAIQLRTRRKMAVAMKGVVAFAGALTLAGLAALYHRPQSNEDASAASAHASATETEGALSVRTVSENADILPGARIAHAPDGKVESIDLFPGTDDFATVTAGSGMITPLLVGREEAGYAGMLSPTICAKMLGISVEELNQNFKNARGTGFILLVDKESGSTFFIAPGICKRFDMQGTNGEGVVSYIVNDIANDMEDFPGYEPSVTLLGKSLESEEELFSLPGVQKLFASLPMAFDRSPQGNQMVHDFAVGNTRVMQDLAAQLESEAE